MASVSVSRGAYSQSIPPVNAEVVCIKRASKILFRGRLDVYTSALVMEWVEYGTGGAQDYVTGLESTDVAFPDGITIDLALTAAELPPPEPDENPLPGSPDGPPIPAASGGGTGEGGYGDDDYVPPPGLPDYPYIPPPTPPDPSPVLTGSYGEYLSESLGYSDRRPAVLLAYSANPWLYFPPMQNDPTNPLPFPQQGVGPYMGATPPDNMADWEYWFARWWAGPDQPAFPTSPPTAGTVRIAYPNTAHGVGEYPGSYWYMERPNVRQEIPMLANPWWICVYELGGFHWPLGSTVDYPLIDRTGEDHHGYAVPDSGVLLAGSAARNENDHSSTYFNGTDGRIVSDFRFPQQTKSMGRRTLFGPEWQPRRYITGTSNPRKYITTGSPEPEKLPTEVNAEWPDDHEHPDIRVTGPEPIPEENWWPPLQPDAEFIQPNRLDYYETKGAYQQTGSISFWCRREDESGNHVLLSSSGPDIWRMWIPEAEAPPWPVGPRDLVVDIDSPRMDFHRETGNMKLVMPAGILWWKGVIPPAGEWFHVMITNALTGGNTGRAPFMYHNREAYGHYQDPDASPVPHRTLSPWWGGFGYRESVPYGGYQYPKSGFWNLFINGEFKGCRAGSNTGPEFQARAASTTLTAGVSDIFNTYMYPRRTDEFGGPILTDPPVGGMGDRFPQFGNLVLGSGAYTGYYPWGAAANEPLADMGEERLAGLEYRSWKGNVADLAVTMLGFDEVAGHADVDPDTGPDVYGQYYVQPWSVASFWFMNPHGRNIPEANTILPPDQLAGIPPLLRNRLDVREMADL